MRPFAIAFIFFIIRAFPLCAQQPDTLEYELEIIEVSSSRLLPGSEQVIPAQSYLKETFQKNGFQMVQRGGHLTGDLYADGLKRGDISLVIDGERFTNACPNRMDPPVSRVNPVLVESIMLNKSSHSVSSSLGGSVEISRKPVEEPGSVFGSFTGGMGNDHFNESTIMGTFHHHRLTIRHLAGKPYTTPDGRTFKDLYGYLQNTSFSQTDGALDGQTGKFRYGAGFNITRDISFPYLQMDERQNEVFNFYTGYLTHKVYANYTSHLMDNRMRTSSKQSVMSTRVWNSTVGFTGRNYDFYGRFWNARNVIGTMKNHQIPDLQQYCGSVNHDWTIHENWAVLGKIGISYFRITDRTVLPNYKILESSATDETIFIPFSGIIQGTMPLSTDLIAGLSFESASDAPVPENLYIHVDKPVGKPDWFGNPTLKSPWRNSIRGYLNGYGIRVETYISSIRNYVILTSRKLASSSYLTFRNADVLITGINLSATWTDYIKADAGYSIAENRSSEKPLAEVAPFHMSVSATTPEWKGLTGSGSLTYHDSQTRVDEDLKEREGRSWLRADAGIYYQLYGLSLSMEIQNLFNETYAPHLNYLRDPFASGLSVQEPGRSFRLSFGWKGTF